ncbi:hypothetical protein NEILACOT_04542 [Neisseria lactamica ATCC 23970]|uniref:Uncharacterized protein n=1 Tax=Neisseria lactamica ATCC 23970 TaxID=546265 RepID=D0WAH1_NEILA|nr:hypothetical protein NEILACOT_04542 [Neisseria lactamica ATCC 23970]
MAFVLFRILSRPGGAHRRLPVNFPLCQKDKGGCDFNACQSVGWKL